MSMSFIKLITFLNLLQIKLNHSLAAFGETQSRQGLNLQMFLEVSLKTSVFLQLLSVIVKKKNNKTR